MKEGDSELKMLITRTWKKQHVYCVIELGVRNTYTTNLPTLPVALNPPCSAQ